jgi:hypothetical protein
MNTCSCNHLGRHTFKTDFLGGNALETEHNVKLTSSELSQIWGAYMNDSLSSCMLKYFLNTGEDTEISSLVEFALKLSQSRLHQLTSIFNNEKYPVPHGFTAEDLNTEAPRLYTDIFILNYLNQMGSMGMNAYNIAVSFSARHDIYLFFTEGLREFNELHKKTLDVLLSKGIFVRPPYIATPKEVDFIKKQNFLTGWLGERRPLTALEIANLHANIQRNSLGIATLTGFSQVAKSKEVGKFISRGIGIASKHVEVFSSIMSEDKIASPMGSDTMVTNSTVAPFSDKLMMFHTTGMIALGIGYYGSSMSTAARRDLALHYTRLTAEIALYSEDGANLMINNGWLEEPPRVVDRDELANT